MKKESSKNDTGKKRSFDFDSMVELFKDVPPVAVLSLAGISSYSIENEADVALFTKGIELNDSWMDKADDEIDGLISAVKKECDSLSNVHFESFGAEAGIEKHLKVILYCSVNELIKNAIKYAFATQIFVQVMAEKDFVSITVYDNGKGFDPKTVTIGSGLGNIATAAIANKGKMNIHSSSKGTEISVEIEL